MEPSHSYKSVQYDLRPAKQAERRMLIDAFQILSEVGYAIREYQYTGMGSIHFVDFVMFHKYLGLTKLLSVELSDAIRARVEFNKPFAYVTTKIGPIGDEIPYLSKDCRHILWLDYDSVVSDAYLRDAALAAAELSVGSIILVTLDAEPPGPREHGAAQWREHYIDQAEEYLDQPNEPSDFRRDQLPRLCVRIVERAIQRGLMGRTGVSMIPLFNFLYADGHTMITVGGMIGTSDDERRIRGSRLQEAEYYRNDLSRDPFIINVPCLTRKERAFLDAHMPFDVGWIPAEFELSPEQIDAYRSVYRFLPSYAEMML